MAQHRFKDERHQTRDREGLHLLRGARRTKQFLLQRKRGKKNPESKHYNRTGEYIIDTQAGTRTQSYEIFFPKKMFTVHTTSKALPLLNEAENKADLVVSHAFI